MDRFLEFYLNEDHLKLIRLKYPIQTKTHEMMNRGMNKTHSLTTSMQFLYSPL